MPPTQNSLTVHNYFFRSNQEATHGKKLPLLLKPKQMFTFATRRCAHQPHTARSSGNGRCKETRHGRVRRIFSVKKRSQKAQTSSEDVGRRSTRFSEAPSTSISPKNIKQSLLEGYPKSSLAHKSTTPASVHLIKLRKLEKLQTIRSTMSFPKELMETFTSSEIHFLAENEPVQVISNVHMDKVTLITTELPRLRLMSAYKIPIWLAIILRKQNKVTVTPPDWLNEKYLANKYQEEVKNPGNFSKLPAKWLEMSKIFLKNFQQDLIDEAEVILKYIQDLKEIRLVKLRKGLQNLNEVNLSFNDLSLMEINEFRPFISEVMGNLARLDRAVENPDDQEGAGEGAFAENVEDNDNEDDVGEGYSRRKDNTQYRVVLENADDVEEDDKDVPEDMEMENIMNEFEL